MADKPHPDRPMSKSAARRKAREAALEEWDEFSKVLGLATSRRIVKPDTPGPPIGRFEGLLLKNYGGFGIVFVARDPELERRVAVKFSILRNEESSELLLREARLMAKLFHPNILPVYEVGRHGDDGNSVPFFVMEYLEGKTAHEFIKRRPKPSWTEIAALYRGAGAGLAAAHKRGVVHGDFKPSNILLDDEDWPRVTDFGFAHYETSGEEDPGEGLRGTWAFMAPEVLDGQDPDHLSDQWSFCVSLWLTLAHTFPFGVHARPAKMRKSIDKGPRLRDRRVPEGLRAIVRRGLSLDPRERFPNMGAIVAELDRVLFELRAEKYAAQAAREAAAESSTQLELGAGRPRSMRARLEPRYRRPFATHALACATTGLLVASLFMFGHADRVQPEQLAETERVEELAPADARVVDETPKTMPGCTPSKEAPSKSIPAHVTVICQAIRRGDVAPGAKAWGSLRKSAYPNDNDPMFKERLSEIVSQARAIHDTLVVVSRSEDYSPQTRTVATDQAKALMVQYDSDMADLKALSSPAPD